MKVFLDTEFTDFIDPKLISLGMVTELGTEIYLEVPFPAEVCSQFVREVVIPMLGKDPNARCETQHLRSRILRWLESQHLSKGFLEICFDFDTDWDLFAAALEHRVPEWCKRQDIWRDIDDLSVEDYFAKTGLPQHHALYDARANRYAYAPRDNAGVRNQSQSVFKKT